MLIYTILIFTVAAFHYGFCRELIKIDCPKLPNGVYVIGCSQQYTVCYTFDIQRKCPRDLYYNTFEGNRDEKKNIEQCRNPIQFEDQIMKSRKFRCVEWKNGVYSSGCSTYYFSCINGQIHWANCKDTRQRYDVASGSCKYPEFVAECNSFLAKLQDSKPHLKEGNFKSHINYSLNLMRVFILNDFIQSGAINENIPVPPISASAESTIEMSVTKIEPAPGPTYATNHATNNRQNLANANSQIQDEGISSTLKRISIGNEHTRLLSKNKFDPSFNSPQLGGKASDLTRTRRENGVWSILPAANYPHQPTHAVLKPTAQFENGSFLNEEGTEDSIHFDQFIGPNSDRRLVW